jgi:hypothetical protein
MLRRKEVIKMFRFSFKWYPLDSPKFLLFDELIQLHDFVNISHKVR